MSRPRSSMSRLTRRSSRTSASNPLGVKNGAPLEAFVAEIQEIAYRGNGEVQDAFDEDYRTGQDRANHVASRVRGEVVLRAIHRTIGLQRRQVRQQEIVFQRVGLIEVDQRARGGIQVTAIAVVPVVLDQGRAPVGQCLGQLLGDGGLATAGAAGDTDEHREHAPTLCHLRVGRRA